MEHHRRKRHHSALKKEIEHVVDEALKEEIPLKYHGVHAYGALAIFLTPNTYPCTMYDLSAIPPDAAINPLPSRREGTIVQAKTLRVRGQLRTAELPSTADAVTDVQSALCLLCRIIIFSWAPACYATSLVSAPCAIQNILDVSQVATTADYILAPHRSGEVAKQVKIHYDEVHNVPPGPVVYDGSISKLRLFPGSRSFEAHVRLDHPIDFNYGTGADDGSGGAGQVFIAFLTNEITTVVEEYPTVHFYSQLYFTDA